MISYPITIRDLLRKISVALPATRNQDGTARRGGKKSWRVRALIEASKIQVNGTCPEDAERIWNELKPVFAKIQGDGHQHVKCAYCERHLDLGKDHLPSGDIDHFRPRVLYPLLAYHPRNYVLSCDVCNQTYKIGHFPIASLKATNPRRVTHLDAELPDLVHPLDPRDVNLQDLIGFEGIRATSVATSGSRDEHRANAMIDLFHLNRRDDLRGERAKILRAIYWAKVTSPDNSTAFRIAQNILQEMQNPFEAHFNCIQSYLKLWDTDSAYAIRLGEEIVHLLEE